MKTKQVPIKVCACGKQHFVIPAGARFSADAVLGGYWFECACHSTLFVPAKKAA
jgi:hypothetical protein